MPVAPGPSDEARQKNIKAEIAAGYPPKQAVAIGYSYQRKAQAKDKKPKSPITKILEGDK